MKMNSISADLELWMSKLPPKLRAIPLIHVAIPGSHDSTTFAITKRSTMSPDVRTPIQYLKFLEPLLRPIMFNWSKTQILDTTEQLKNGIRYFDLRIATKPATDGFYFVHNLYSEQVDEVFNAIRRFLDTHKHEVVILDCQHFFSFNSEDHKCFISLLISIFGNKLLPYMSNMSQITLEYMKKCQCQLIVIYRSDAGKNEKLLWSSDSFPTPWPNTVTVDNLITCLDDGLRVRNCLLGYISQCVLTPNLWYVCRHLFSSLEKKCVLPLEKHKYEWLKKQKPGIGGINIVISDFINYQDCQFSKEVINLNQKLLNEINVPQSSK